jgi:hypothetical protein
MIFSTLNLDQNNMNLALFDPKIHIKKSMGEYKTIEIKLRLEHMNVSKKDDLHRKIREVIFP